MSEHKHVLGMTRAEIVEHKDPCQTAPNGTGARCACSYDCANYWLRAFGYREEEDEGLGEVPGPA